jgi:hypothetical protein
MVLPKRLEGEAIDMMGGEAVDLGSLLGRVAPDAMVLVERVLQQTQEQLTRNGALTANDQVSPDQVVVTALGNRLARIILNTDSSAAEDWSTVGFLADELSHYEELIDRNSVLAAALGACDCWGQHVSCRFCNGVGGPGWTLPDERLFASYVRPALHAATDPSGSSTLLQHEAQSRRKEGGNG